MPKKEKKLKQANLENEVIEAGDVFEDLVDVSYVDITWKNEKFKLHTRDTALRGIEPKALRNFIRKRLRPLAKAEINKGDFDKATEHFYMKAVSYPR